MESHHPRHGQLPPIGASLGGQDALNVEFAASPIQRTSPTGGNPYQREPGRESALREGSGPSERVASGVKDTLELSPDARRELERMRATDKAVRAHEAAHMAAGAGIVRGGASFTTRKGPDGQMYATGGEVSIDGSPVPNNPRATLAKAQQIQSAALAPADPSAQDRKVAAQAAQMAAQASQELARQGTGKGPSQRPAGIDLMA